MFIRDYRLEIQSVMLVNSTLIYTEKGGGELNQREMGEGQQSQSWVKNIYTNTVCGGGYGVLGLRQLNTCSKVPFQVNFYVLRIILNRFLNEAQMQASDP